jgi:hypothetical protein
MRLHFGRRQLAHQRLADAAERTARQKLEACATEHAWSNLLRAASEDLGPDLMAYVDACLPDAFGYQDRAHEFHLHIPGLSPVRARYGRGEDGQWRRCPYVSGTKDWVWGVTAWKTADQAELGVGALTTTLEEALALAEEYEQERQKLAGTQATPGGF